MIEGYNLRYFVGVMTNLTDAPIEFLESNCGNWQTAAVTSWPLKVLAPKQQTEIYVAMKASRETPPELVRKPLIGREYR